jgi:hypothetical protein
MILLDVNVLAYAHREHLRNAGHIQITYIPISFRLRS